MIVGELEVHRPEYERSFTEPQHRLVNCRTITGMAVNVRSQRDTRERIHEAGLELFNARGYTGTSVRELADACGLTPGAMYNHYSSKEALLFAIVDRAHDLADAVLSETLRSVGSDPVAQLEALAAAFTAFHIARPRETRVANRDYIYRPGVQRDSVVRRPLQESAQRLVWQHQPGRRGRSV